MPYYVWARLVVVLLQIGLIFFSSYAQEAPPQCARLQYANAVMLFAAIVTLITGCERNGRHSANCNPLLHVVCMLLQGMITSAMWTLVFIDFHVDCFTLDPVGTIALVFPLAHFLFAVEAVMRFVRFVWRNPLPLLIVDEYEENE